MSRALQRLQCKKVSLAHLFLWLSLGQRGWQWRPAWLIQTLV